MARSPLQTTVMLFVVGPCLFLGLNLLSAPITLLAHGVSETAAAITALLGGWRGDVLRKQAAPARAPSE